jgi:hypothetical protein
MASTKELKPLIKQAEKQGWTVERTRAGKLKWISPAGGIPYFSSFTPSDRKAVHNIAAALRQRGLVTASK